MTINAHVKKRMTGKERYEQILDVSCRLFAEYGFDSVSTKQLAAELDCSEALIFRHFPSKEAIFEALFEEWKQAQKESFSIPIINNSVLASLGAQYDALIARSWERTTSAKYRPFLTQAMMGRPSYTEQIAEVIVNTEDIVTASIVPVIELGKQTGEITSSVDSTILGKTFWTLTVGSAYIFQLFPHSAASEPLPFEQIAFIFK